MYLALYDVENFKEFHNDILLCEYYPKTSFTNNGVMLPVMYSQAHNGYIFNEVFAKVPQLYQDCANNYSSEKNQDILFTFEEYKNCVDNLVNGLSSIYNGRYRFRTKDVVQMYDHYRKIHKSGMWVAGLVNMVPDNQLANTDSIDPLIPSEGYATILGFNTYVKSVSELVPNLNLDLETALYLYKEYRNEIGCDQTVEGEEIPFIMNNSLQAISSVVSQLTAEIPTNDIELILSDAIPDSSLVGYYQTMLQNYGVRERVAKVLLTYRDYRLQKTVYNIVVKNARLDTAREIVLFPKKDYTSKSTTPSSLLGRTLF